MKDQWIWRENNKMTREEKDEKERWKKEEQVSVIHVKKKKTSTQPETYIIGVPKEVERDWDRKTMFEEIMLKCSKHYENKNTDPRSWKNQKQRKPFPDIS